jgi:hypothetical protein
LDVRDYLYVWHDPKEQFVVASGLCVRDFVPLLDDKKCLILLDHKSVVASYDSSSRFSYVTKEDLSEFLNEDIYSWGDFAWADCVHGNIPHIPDKEIAELLFFAHHAKPLGNISLSSIRNGFLAYAHDDGWYLKVYYQEWKNISGLMLGNIPEAVGILDIDDLRKGRTAFWLKGGAVKAAEKTHDIDHILNGRKD